MTRSFQLLFLWIVLCTLTGWWLGASAGWALLGLGLLVPVVINALQQARVARWTQDTSTPPPAAIGLWDPVLAPVYRTLRNNQRELARLRQHVQGLLQAAEAFPDGALTLNARLELTWCNQTARKHLGLKPSSDLGYSIFNVLRVPEFARYARQRSWPAPIMISVHGTVEPRTLMVHMSQYGLRQYLIITRDITQVQRLETMRKDFVANVSHELRTPLTVLSGFLETLQDNPDIAADAQERQHYLQLMDDQAGRMQRTVSDLLTLSTLESTPHANGKLLEFETLVGPLIEQARILSDGRHQFELDIENGLTLVGVSTELASAMSNLLANAVHYTPVGGQITVRWHRNKDGSATFSVQDTGIGISSQDIPRLTERFYRTDRGRSRENGGTGLGLAIARHVALRHDAELSIRSRLGEGSTFEMHFPAERVACTDNDDPPGPAAQP
ncbi:MAG TPA: phosphate regulon sensor histidine kinase PhoR [Burkholderiaceae bacterium]|nr:phosphate regulon sensor histidine kinase PhoR [Burkholderiaceae bacterium]